jgi:hypothetical protein
VLPDWPCCPAGRASEPAYLPGLGGILYAGASSGVSPGLYGALGVRLVRKGEDVTLHGAATDEPLAPQALEIVMVLQEALRAYLLGRAGISTPHVLLQGGVLFLAGLLDTVAQLLGDDDAAHAAVVQTIQENVARLETELRHVRQCGRHAAEER